MNDIQYQNEHLWAGEWGHFLSILLFTSSLTSSISFLYSLKDKSFINIAKVFLYLNIISVIYIFSLILWMLFNHYFEYQYVWQHSNKTMNKQFILSCLWEGQEGSFLLWITWQALLSIILLRQLNTIEQPIPMGIFMLVQTFLATMILGVYIGDTKIGSSLFLLLREHPNFMNLPFLQNPDYLKTLDGRGLNPLLENYWMTIHPPTLFLGFASTLVPFTLSVYGLITKNYQGWQQNGIKWAFFSVLVLGMGILMGGAWAYEALSFGGFWAWDPVENSSLVPWLFTVASAHLMILNNKKKGSYFITHLFSIAVFILVLYSTFLTRSGILGNASVHAFTDLGMQGQLLLFIFFFIALSVWSFTQELLLKNFYWMSSFIFLILAMLHRDYQKFLLITWLLITTILLIYSYIKYYQEKEEDISSKEFWMFIGSMLLFLAGIIIIYFTSIPVFNKLFNWNKAPIKPEDYNLWMIPIASIIFIVTGIAQFLKYGKTIFLSIKKYIISDAISSCILSLIIFVLLYITDKDISITNKISYFFLLISSIYTVIGNFHYWVSIAKTQLKKIASLFSHVGFGLIILGALISTSKKYHLTPHSSSILANKLGDDFDKQKSIVLIQNDTVQAGNFYLNYEKMEKKGYTYYFKVNYLSKNVSKNNLVFTLYPRVQDNPIMGKAADPDTKHFLLYDIYTHVTYADLSDEKNNSNVPLPTNYRGHLHDTIFTDKAIVVIDSIFANKTYKEFSENPDELEITIRLKVIEASGKFSYIYPQYIIKNKTVFPTTEKLSHLGLSFTIWKLHPDTEEIEIAVTEKENSKNFIVINAIVFPMINLLWLGCIMMSFGVLLYLIQILKR